MTDYNSMKADEYAQRQGELDELDSQVEVVADELFESIPDWLKNYAPEFLASASYGEAKRRVMQAIKERGEP